MISVLRVLLGIAISSVLVSPTAADVLVYESGRTSREGKVVEIDRTSVRFEEDLEGSRQVPRSSIKEIRWSGYESILNLSQPGTPDADLSEEFRKLAFAALTRANAARGANDLAQARAEYRKLFDALSQKRTAAEQLLGAGEYERIFTKVVTDLPPISFELGKRYLASQVPKEAKPFFHEAAYVNVRGQAFNNRLNPEYSLELGKAAEADRDFAMAASAYQTVLQSPGAPAEMVSAAQQGLQKVQAGSGGQSVAPVGPATATPVPIAIAQATPVAVAGSSGAPRGPVPAPLPTPVPTIQAQPAVAAAQATPPPGPRWKQILWELERSDVGVEVKRLPEAVINGEHTGVILGLSIIVLVGWIMPYSFLAYRARRGDLFASEYMPVAKKAGLFALIPWARKVAGQRPPKDLCPYCNKGIDNIESYTDLNFYACPHCRENITPIYELKDYVNHLVSQLEMASQRKATGGDMSTILEKDAMLKLVRGILTLAIRRRASDLHAECDSEGMKIRARIDGIMYDMMTLPQSIANPFISSIKVMTNLDITERRMPQDGKLSIWVDKADVDLRINTSPSSLGEKISIRVLTQKALMVDPTKLGLEGDNLEKYQRTIHRPHGLVIVTGPSGSGKSTTLFVALSEINTGDKNIVTIEDPIEYQIKGVSQMQVNPAANFTFATGLRSILRQDPDVIMVGEIRDKETAEIAMDAATTGHLVFTTLHTIDSPTAFSRLADLGVETRRVSSAVSCVMGQRLIRTICNDCRKPYKPKKSDLDALGIGDNPDNIAFVHGAGCDTCMNTGYYGRTAIFEFLMPDNAMREILEVNASVSVIRELARKTGYRSLREEGILKIASGISTPEEVIRLTS